VAKLGQDDKHSLGCNLMLQVFLVLTDASREDDVSCGVRQKPRHDVHLRSRKGKVVNNDKQVPDCNGLSRGGVSLIISTPHTLQRNNFNHGQVTTASQGQISESYVHRSMINTSTISLILYTSGKNDVEQDTSTLTTHPQPFLCTQQRSTISACQHAMHAGRIVTKAITNSLTTIAGREPVTQFC
jgi:hypothetical protein